MTRTFDAHDVTTRYAGLGLIANPFLGFGGAGDSPSGREVTSESNALLEAIVSAMGEEKPRPIWVAKSEDIPDPYHLSAESRVQSILAQDESLSALHAYVPLFAMKSGAVRATLATLAERLMFRQFDQTLALYVERVLAAPDDTLISYQVLGPDDHASFARKFAENPIAAVHAVFGAPENERQLELKDVADMRQFAFEGDVDEGTDSVEIDETVGDAPGTVALMANRAAEASESSRAAVADYIIEYTREHLSPVVGRALRVFQDRGTMAAVAELKITKAPRKTLAAIAKLARVRFRKTVIMYDGFANWLNIDAALRSKIVGILSEIRWALAEDAVMVFLVSNNRAPELEEAFGSGTRITWDFPGVVDMEERRGQILDTVVNRWLANAASPGVEPLTVDSPAIAAMIESADGSLEYLVDVGATAIEIAAESGASELTSEHVAAAVSEMESTEA